MQNEKGFTLVEVVVVTVIIAALALLVVPSFKNSAMTNQMEKAKVGLVELTTAVKLYNEVNSSNRINNVTFTDVVYSSLTLSANDENNEQGYQYLQNSGRWAPRGTSGEYSLKDAASEGGVLKCKYIIGDNAATPNTTIISQTKCEFKKVDEEGTECYKFYIHKNNPAVVKKELLQGSVCEQL